MEDEIYNVKKPRITKIEDDSLYKRYNQVPAKDVPIDDLRPMLKMFFDKAAVNMGKESYDAPDVAIESILEFIYREYGILPIFYIASSIIKGSLGKYGSGRLVPNTVYKWLHEGIVEFDRIVKHGKYNSEYTDVMDLHKYPAGSAIAKKIDWHRKGILKIEDWDNVPLRELSEKIKAGHNPTPETFGLIKT